MWRDGKWDRGGILGDRMEERGVRGEPAALGGAGPNGGGIPKEMGLGLGFVGTDEEGELELVGDLMLLLLLDATALSTELWGWGEEEDVVGEDCGDGRQDCCVDDWLTEEVGANDDEEDEADVNDDDDEEDVVSTVEDDGDDVLTRFMAVIGGDNGRLYEGEYSFLVGEYSLLGGGEKSLRSRWPR